MKWHKCGEKGTAKISDMTNERIAKLIFFTKQLVITNICMDTCVLNVNKHIWQ